MTTAAFFDIGDTLGAVRVRPSGDGIDEIAVYPGVRDALAGRCGVGDHLRPGRDPGRDVAASLDRAGVLEFFDPALVDRPQGLRADLRFGGGAGARRPAAKAVRRRGRAGAGVRPGRGLRGASPRPRLASRMVLRPGLPLRFLRIRVPEHADWRARLRALPVDLSAARGRGRRPYPGLTAIATRRRRCSSTTPGSGSTASAPTTRPPPASCSCCGPTVSPTTRARGRRLRRRGRRHRAGHPGLDGGGSARGHPGGPQHRLAASGGRPARAQPQAHRDARAARGAAARPPPASPRPSRPRRPTRTWSRSCGPRARTPAPGDRRALQRRPAAGGRGDPAQPAHPAPRQRAGRSPASSTTSRRSAG